MQKTDFMKEIDDLEKARVLKNSTLISLNPFLDNYGLLRVGGPLRNANLPETVKFHIYEQKISSSLQTIRTSSVIQCDIFISKIEGFL